jgi:hypothetical protein
VSRYQFSADRAQTASVALQPKTKFELNRANPNDAAFRTGILLTLLFCLLFIGAGHASAQSLTAPSTLTALTFSKNQINLQWNDPNPSGAGASEAGYVIERAKGSPANFTEASVTGPNVTSWPNMSLSAGTTYYFRVRAFVITNNVTTYSAYSPVANATTQSTLYPDPPVGLMASVVSSSQVKLTWQNKAANATGYHIQQTLDGSNWSVIGSAAASANYFIVGALAAQTLYTYRVTAFNGTGESPASNTAAAITKASSDSIAPAGTVVINSGVSAVASAAVTLSQPTHRASPDITYRLHRPLRPSALPDGQPSSALPATAPPSAIRCRPEPGRAPCMSGTEMRQATSRLPPVRRSCSTRPHRRTGLSWQARWAPRRST